MASVDHRLRRIAHMSDDKLLITAAKAMSVCESSTIMNRLRRA